MNYPEQIKTEPENQKETLQPDGAVQPSTLQVKDHTHINIDIYPPYNTANTKNRSNRKQKSPAEKHLPKRCSIAQLDEVRIGDSITNADGIKGIVADIYISSKKYEKHYYLRLKHGVTLLYII